MSVATLLEAMLRLPSPSGREQPLALFLAEQMRARGLESRIDAVGNVIGSRQGAGPIEREIMLLGHLDTVPGEIPVRVEGGMLYGRGAVDAKGPLAVFIEAAARATLPAGSRVIVAGAVEEESATSRGARHLAERYNPTHCVIGEPSGWETTTLGYKGRVLLDYRLEQPAGHSAGPSPAVAERAIAFWTWLQGVAARHDGARERHWERLLPSLRRIESRSDGLTDSVEMTVGLRLPPDFDVVRLEVAARDVAGPATLRFYAHEPAFRVARGSPLGRAMDRAIRAEGGRPRHSLKSGTSDMNVVGPRWGGSILAYGPGDSRLDHTPCEHVSLDELSRATRVLEHLLSQELPQ